MSHKIGETICLHTDRLRVSLAVLAGSSTCSIRYCCSTPAFAAFCPWLHASKLPKTIHTWTQPPQRQNTSQSIKDKVHSIHATQPSILPWLTTAKPDILARPHVQPTQRQPCRPHFEVHRAQTSEHRNYRSRSRVHDTGKSRSSHSLHLE